MEKLKENFHWQEKKWLHFMEREHYQYFTTEKSTLSDSSDWVYK